MNAKNHILKSLLLEMQLEALDFKNIEPYPISKGGVFHTDNNVVVVDIEHMPYDQVEAVLKNGLIKVTGDVFRHSLDFYKNKGGEIKIYNVNYKVDGSEIQAKITSYKEYVRILYTVFLYVKEFVEREKPFALFIFGAPKREGNTGDQKNLVYSHVVRTHLPTGYMYSEAKLQKNPGIVMYMKTLPNKK